MTLLDFLLTVVPNTQAIVGIEWPDADDWDADPTPILKWTGKHFAAPQGEAPKVFYKDIPEDVVMDASVLNYTFLQGKVLKPCPKCGGDGTLEVMDITGPWSPAKSTVYPCPAKCEKGWVAVTEADLAKRREWQAEVVA